MRRLLKLGESVTRAEEASVGEQAVAEYEACAQLFSEVVEKGPYFSESQVSQKSGSNPC